MSGLSQVKPLELIKGLKDRLKESFTYHPAKWILHPEKAYFQLSQAATAAGHELTVEAFQKVVDDAASFSALDFYERI